MIFHINIADSFSTSKVKKKLHTMNPLFGHFIQYVEEFYFKHDSYFTTEIQLKSLLFIYILR